MATQTFLHSSFGNGQVIVEFDVNDANWRVSRVRCINNSAYAASARILQNGIEIFIATAPANQTTSWSTSGIQLGWDTVNGGIIMGLYTIQTSWPSE